jgi:hypothetical protein
MARSHFLLIPGVAILCLASTASQSSGSTAQEPQKQGSNISQTTDPTIVYLQTARNLLNQVSVEYKSGNFTGAEELATKAYLDNFEYVEPVLEKKGATDILHQLEDMMRKDLRNMIKDEVLYEKLGSHISATDAKLAEAIAIVNSSK